MNPKYTLYIKKQAKNNIFRISKIKNIIIYIFFYLKFKIKKNKILLL